MRITIVPLVLALFISSELFSHGSLTDNSYSKHEIAVDRFPATITEVHAKLQTFFSEDQLVKMKAMENKYDMLGFFFGARDSIDRMCGLSRDSTLAKYLRIKGFVNKEEMTTAILESFWLENKGHEVNIEEISADYKAYREENTWPDTSSVDPEDESTIIWNRSLGAEGRPHRRIYIGESRKKRRLLAYENGVGVYVPGTDLLRRLEEIDATIIANEIELRSNGAPAEQNAPEPAETESSEEEIY